jgi:16S rRNA (guanine527-N7)-methyltransferase
LSDLRALLRAGLEELGLEAPEDAVAGLVTLAELLARWSPRINLTGYKDAEAIVRRLILDAAALWGALRPASRVADLGSGAGIPGFPIAILAPQTRVLLIEARLRRHHFQKAAQRSLGLDNVALLHGRMEELPPEPCDLVVAQAVAPPEQVLRWMLPWASASGRLTIPGSRQAPNPVANGRSAAELGLLDTSVVPYQVPLGGPARTVWVARRAGPSS